MNLYQLTNVIKAFHKRTLIDIEHLELESEKVYALIGPNGAGKTILLDILGFLEKPTSGDIKFMGKRVDTSENQLQSLRRQVVLVSQRPILFSSSVYKNIEFGLKIRRVSKATRQRLIEETLDLVGMRHMITAPARKLSGGENQRVALARALALSPKIILCDEPTSSLDLESQSAIIRLLKRINEEEKITIILTSHNQAEVSSLAHQSLFIDNGKLSDALYENLFMADLRPHRNGRAICSLNDSLRIEIDAQNMGKKRILINPEKIDFVLPSQNSTPINTLNGKIAQISMDRSAVRIVVDIGIPLTIKTDEAHYRVNRFLVGDPVMVSIPKDAINIL